MFRTRITELLGIEYPIIQGGMLWLSDAEFAAAVSNAGALGIITALSYETTSRLREEIRKCRDLTDRPFGVNVSMLPDITPGDKTEGYFDVIIEEAVPIVETSGRSPEPFMEDLKRAGVKVIHKVPAVRYAQTAQRVGVDAVALVGYECAGHPGMDDVTTLILIQKATNVLQIPVIAGGGFYDSRGFVAAMALGAEGVLMGTRFLLTQECWAHPAVKERFLTASERDTMLIERSIENTARVMKNEAAMRAHSMEEYGTTLEELLTVISGKLGLKAWKEGDVDAGVLACGQVVGLIDTLKTIPEVIEEIVEGAREIYGRLGAILSGSGVNG